MPKTYLNDIGTEIILDSGEDISGQTTLEIKYKKPEGDTGTWTASVYNTNYAKYTTVDGDLDEIGTWTVQIYVVLPSWTGHGEAAQFKVYAVGT
jgi:hypothetical protein